MKRKKPPKSIKAYKHTDVDSEQQSIYNEVYADDTQIKKTKEGDGMTEIMMKLQQVQIPAHQLAKLGLKSNWQKSVSPDFLDKAIKAANKHKEVLKELAKY